MTDDDILKEIGKSLAEPDALDDPNWENLRQGQLDEKQRRELEELENQNPHISGALEAFQPLSPEFRARLEHLVENTASEDRQDNISLLRQRPHKPRYPFVILAGGLAALAAAAALILVVLPETPSPVPSYHYEFAGGEREIRGQEAAGDGEIPDFTQSSLLEMRLRPEKPSSSPVRVYGFLVGEDHTQPVSLPLHISQSGVLTLQGRVSKLFRVQPGTYKIVVVVTTDEEPIAQPILPLKRGNRRVNRETWEVVQPLRIVGDGS